MADKQFKYVIVGGGLAGVSAVEGIGESDKSGSILLLCNENNMPYDRPPLSKKLWFGKKTVDEIFLHDRAFYSGSGVELTPGVAAVALNRTDKTIATSAGDRIRYSKLLLATGGVPRRLDIPGGNLDEICYYRTLDDYKRIRALASPGKRAVVIGGGFIGSEIAAALNINKLEVSMVFPEEYLVQRIFPEGLGTSLQKHFIERGVAVCNQDSPVSFEKTQSGIVTATKKGKRLVSDMVIAGIGIVPSMDLAKNAGLDTGNGVIVNNFLQTTDPDVYAAGDIANFYSTHLGERMRVEHWDNAIAQGKVAGRNMAGVKTAYDHIPYFFSDLFEFGYEAAGEINSELEIFADWKKVHDTGVIYYLKNGIVKGVMLCNVWDKIEAARDLIKKRRPAAPEQLKGAIAF